MFARGDIGMKNQAIAKLADTLPNFIGKLVVDETGLAGRYDFPLPCGDNNRAILLDALNERYGLILEPVKRKVRMPVIEPHANRFEESNLTDPQSRQCRYLIGSPFAAALDGLPGSGGPACPTSL